MWTRCPPVTFAAASSVRTAKPSKLASVELYRAGQYDDTRPGLVGLFRVRRAFSISTTSARENMFVVYNRMNRMDPNSPFPRSFYPGSTDAGGAEPIVLKDGQQLLKANIKLREGYPDAPAPRPREMGGRPASR